MRLIRSLLNAAAQTLTAGIVREPWMVDLGMVLGTGFPPFRHAEFAASFLQAMSFEISANMRKHQLKLADRQSHIAELSGRVQTAVVILCTSLYAGRHEDPTIQRAGDILATSLTNQLLGRRSTDRHLRALTTLGAFVAEHHFPALEDVTPLPILMAYG